MPPTEETTWTDAASGQTERTETLEGRVIVERSAAGRSVIRRPSGSAHRVFALPSFLEKRVDGAIVVRGHRVTLFSILEFIIANPPAAGVLSLTNAFPTIPQDLMWKILTFYINNPDAIRAYFYEQQDVAANNERLHPYVGPSLTELRRRRQALR
jgi:hypothetical protein